MQRRGHLPQAAANLGIGRAQHGQQHRQHLVAHAGNGAGAGAQIKLAVRGAESEQRGFDGGARAARGHLLRKRVGYDVVLIGDSYNVILIGHGNDLVLIGGGGNDVVVIGQGMMLSCLEARLGNHFVWRAGAPCADFLRRKSEVHSRMQYTMTKIARPKT